jgi:Raf kinase inhibitor-like YbhB/YbcL family protein
MELTSPSFEANQPIPARFTCDGDNVNPALSLQDVPDETKSLALIMDDPDAPRGDWVHWLMWNIAPNTTEIGERSVPGGAMQGRNDFGNPSYGGPCPHQGTHHYHFKLYALNDLLSLSETTTKAELLEAMRDKIIDQTELIGTYARD